MTRPRGLVLPITLLIACEVCADEPPSWQPFSVCTDSKQHCAQVSPNSESDEPWAVEWSLTVTERGANAEQGRELWSSVFHYDGYDGGILALDGTSFVTVSFWYWTESPVVTIYRDGEIHSLRGRAFRIPRRKLVETVSHRLWLSQDKKPYGLVGTDRMLINTIDGQQHVVDLTTGMLVNDE